MLLCLGFIELPAGGCMCCVVLFWRCINSSMKCGFLDISITENCDDCVTDNQIPTYRFNYTLYYPRIININTVKITTAIIRCIVIFSLNWACCGVCR
jgi:hypothetical protein